MPEEDGERKEAPTPPPVPTPPAELLQMAELMAEALANSFNENSAITEQLLETLPAKPSGSGGGDLVGIKTVFSRMLSDLSGASKADATTVVGRKETTVVGGKDGGGKVRWDEEEENDIARAINVCGGTASWTNIYNHLRDSGSKVVLRGKINISRHWSYIKNEYPVLDGKIIIPATAGRAKQLRKRSEKLIVKRQQQKPPPPLPTPEQTRQPPPMQPQPPPKQPQPLQPPPKQPQPLQPPPKQPLQAPPKQPQSLQPPPNQSSRDSFLEAAALTFVRHEDYMKEMVRNIFEEMWKEKMGGQ